MEPHVTQNYTSYGYFFSIHVILIYRKFWVIYGTNLRVLFVTYEQCIIMYNTLGGLGIDPQWCHLGFFPRLPTEPYALGLTQPLKMSTRKIPGSKAGRCVRLTTYHLLVPNVKKIRGLNLPDLPWPVQACSGTALLYFTTLLFGQVFCMGIQVGSSL